MKDITKPTTNPTLIHKQHIQHISKMPYKAVFSLFILFLFCALTLLTTTGCSAKETAIEKPPTPVKVMTLGQSSYDAYSEYFGTIESENIKKYSFLNGGKIATLPISLGDKVSVGTVLATLDTEDYSLLQKDAAATFEAAKSAFDFANTNYEKMLRLFEDGAISQLELDTALQKKNQAQASLTSATVNYNNANNTVKNTVIRSDMPGIIAQVTMEVGETVGAGTPVVIVSSTKQKVFIGVSIEDIQKILPGTKVKIIYDAKTELQGTIKNIGKLPDMSTRTYPVEIDIPESSLILGSFVNVYIPVGQESGIQLPISCILDDGESYVYLVGEGEKVEKRPIELGEIQNMNVVVTGINEGERVIIEGMRNIEEGQLVKVATE